MNNKILKLILIVVIAIILCFDINSVKAENKVVAKITMAFCEWETGQYIPGGGTTSGGKLTFKDNGLSNGIYYCANNGKDGNGAGFTYFVTNPNPTKRIFFPTAYWTYVNDPSVYSEKPYITLTDVDWSSFNKTENDEYLKILEDTLKANPAYAKAECEKYCNACHLTKGGYAYYCNDYNLKKNYYTYSPLNFKGEGKAWSNFGWEYLDLIGHALPHNWGKELEVIETKYAFDDVINECWKSEYNYCQGSLIYMDDKALSNSEITLTSGKECWNYLANPSYDGELVGSSVTETLKNIKNINTSNIDGERYWVCSTLGDCKDTCLGKCVSPKEFHSETHSYIGAMKSDVKAYYCLGTKDRNSRFSNGDSTEDPKYFTTDYDKITSMIKYDGDNIPASIGNIYKVGTGKITCEGVFGKDGKSQFSKILRSVFKYMRIAAIGLFIIFTTLDFIGAISGSEDKPMKKATKNLTTRFIILLILLVLPTLINILLSIVEIKNGLCFLN